MKKLVFSILVAIIATLAFALFMSQIDFEEYQCPFCYGQDFCHNKSVTLRFSSLSDVINNLVSVKNVYFMTIQIVLKKLGHAEHLNKLNHDICISHGKEKDCVLNNLDVGILDYAVLLREVLGDYSNSKGYKICGDQAVDMVLKRLQTDENDEFIHLWTISLINFEPIFYKLFGEQFRSLPNYYGACGRIIAVENCGKNVGAFELANWNTRATIARSIIDLAVEFTFRDEDFHIYLTDLSPDNIVVDEVTLKVKFVDFGNVILVQKSNVSNVHISEYISEEEGFAYFESDICKSSISDHNFYSICKLLLSDDVPWPMMKGGLLHSIPEEIQRKKSTLRITQLIKTCVQPDDKHDRFESIAKLDDALRDILSNY